MIASAMGDTVSVRGDPVYVCTLRMIEARNSSQYTQIEAIVSAREVTAITSGGGCRVGPDPPRTRVLLVSLLGQIIKYDDKHRIWKALGWPRIGQSAVPDVTRY